MSSNKWNNIYKTNNQLSIYPWSNLVGIVKNLFKNRKKNYRVLEIGCGFGANINFLLDCGFEYYGVDYSAYAISNLKKRFPKLQNNLFLADFTKEKLPKKIKFNVIIDRASGTHCTTSEFTNFLELYSNNFSKNIMYIGVDWFSKKCTDAKKGKKIDSFTKSNFKTGQFKNCGNVHFSNDTHIKKDLFKKWKCILLRENISILKSKKNYKVCTYDFVMKR
jgi:SAM-dependent methyltransferase